MPGETMTELKLHNVRFNLTNKYGPQNKVFVDDQEIHHVTELKVVARRGSVSEVSISFFVDTVEGNVEGAQEMKSEDVPAND
jgi:hypothetical protein